MRATALECGGGVRELIRESGHSSFAVALAVSILLQAATRALAWVRLGRRGNSRVAENNPNPRARPAIAELLEPDETRADASTWAD